jgi:hypothetical protein
MELGNETGGAQTLVALAGTYGYTPVLLSSFYSADGGPIRPFNDSTRAAYLEGTLQFVDERHPKYMAFGIEVNVLYERYPETFEDFVDFYPIVYDSVKMHSPETMIFTTFELENMKGLHGGLFGGVNDTTNTQWHLLNRFPVLDLIGFSTYPGLIYMNPSEIPSDYYETIPDLNGLAYCFTEMGWHSSAFPVGWESSEQEQADFVDLFFSLNEPHSAEFIVWSFMYDPATSQPFNAMGLRRSSDGGAKIAWDVWINY